MQSSNVLVIGHPAAKSLDFGADTSATLTEARALPALQQFAVLVFGGEGAEFDAFCAHALEQAPDALWIVSAADGVSAARLLPWCNRGRVHALIDDFSDPELERSLKSALEASGEQAQRQQLVAMFEEQSARLKRLSADLESRVQKRHKTLRKSLRTLEQTKQRMLAFHNALLGIHRASTVFQMEQTLNEALAGAVDIEWVRVRFAQQSLLQQKRSGPHILPVELPFQHDNARGEVLFGKGDGKRFSATEQDFLQELGGALALALGRLEKLEQAETLKGHWQATFDAIPHPLCLTGAEFEILKLNRAFQQACATESFHDLIGKNCFRVFFGADFSPPARLEAPFTFRHARRGIEATEYYEVVGQRLGESHLLLLRSITEEVRFERRILDGSKLAELGTIGSSIAHELNNPLGGMLSFLQLVLMDLRRDDPLYPEIKQMEQATLRCRDIVQNLLSFARKQDLGDFAPVDLWDVLERAVKLIELQSKSMGVAIALERGPPARVSASPNALTQAFCNLLQNALDAIAERLKTDPLYPGRIGIELTDSGPSYGLKIADNGTGIRPEVQSQIFNPLFTTRDPGLYSGMGLTSAYTIIADHGGSLEILSRAGSGTSAIISLPRLADSPD